MKQLATEKQARLTYLKRQLVMSVTHSRYFKVNTATYDPPQRAIPIRVKELLKEIGELEVEVNSQQEVKGHEKVV